MTTFLENHPYFDHKEELNGYTHYLFKGNGKKCHLYIYKNRRYAMGFQTELEEMDEWFRELYAKTLLEEVEELKTKVLLKGEPAEEFEMIEAYIKAQSLLKRKGTQDQVFLTEYLTKAEKEFGIKIAPRTYQRWKKYKEGREAIENYITP